MKNLQLYSDLTQVQFVYDCCESQNVKVF